MTTSRRESLSATHPVSLFVDGPAAAATHWARDPFVVLSSGGIIDVQTPTPPLPTPIAPVPKRLRAVRSWHRYLQLSGETADSLKI